MTTERTFTQAFIAEPMRMIASQPAQVGISGLSMLFTAIFFADPFLEVPWLPHWLIFGVAGGAALGVEYAFLKGVADRAYVEAYGGGSFWGNALILTVWFLMVASGTTVLLTYAYKLPWFVSPPGAFAVLLSLSHIIPLSMIAACSAQLHAGAERLAVQRRTREEEETKQRMKEAEDRQKSFEERKLEIDTQVYEAEQKAYARHRVRSVAPTVPDTVPGQSSRSVARLSDNEKAKLREQIVTLIRAHGADINVSRESKALGIRRQMWYDLKADAERRGEL